MLTRPQKAPSEPISDLDLESLEYPVMGSPKLDGFRCVISGGKALTSSLKPISNKFVFESLSRPEYEGLDGELIVGRPNSPNAFANTTGPLRRLAGIPDFTFYVFDIHNMPGVKYAERNQELYQRYLNLPNIQIIKQERLASPDEVLKYESWCVSLGYEGIMVRTAAGVYKEGRCTLKEKNIFKRKPVEDDEATIVGFIEQMENLNESSINELGLNSRSSNAANKIGKSTLGAFVLSSPKWAETFMCGTGQGLTDKLRKKIWNDQSAYLGKLVTYKYQAHGSINAPRQPIFKGFRDATDMTTY